MSSTLRCDAPGCRIAYDVRGAGPPVLFIQGVGVHGDGWRPQVDELQRDFTCATFDNRGMGESRPFDGPITVPRMALDALAVADALGWDRFHVVGHSLGGVVAVAIGLAHRERVRSLALLCTVANGRHATRLSRRMLWLGLRSRIGTRAMRRRAFLEIVLPPTAIDHERADALAAALADLFGHDLADQPPVAMAQLAALRAYDATSRLAELASVPTLVVSATHDPIAPPWAGRTLANGIPGARYVEFGDASHGVPIQQPREINALLRDHLNT
jgi:pimeloyl-ACP methyl ester carboxylesterase